jgi:hypothetical protein
MFTLLQMISAFVVGSLLFAKCADAAEVTCFSQQPNSKYCRDALLQGQIVKGDYEKVVSLYAINHPHLYRFALQSAGGDVNEAMKIGRIFRRYLISAEAPLGHGDSAAFPSASALREICRGVSCVCASACALIWYGATTRSGTVGLHRPHFNGTGFAELTPAEAEAAYKPLLTNLTHYLEEMEAPASSREAMIATSSAEARWIDSVNLESPPSFAEWIQAGCSHLSKPTPEEISLDIHFHERDSKRDPERRLSEPERSRLSLLDQKIRARSECEETLIAKNRAKLPPPDINGLPDSPPTAEAATLEESAKAIRERFMLEEAAKAIRNRMLEKNKKGDGTTR